MTVRRALPVGDPHVLFHLNRAMDNGLTREEAGEVIAHVAFYAGGSSKDSSPNPQASRCSLSASRSC
jgi:Carboxymuconolactone decarboxylase family